MKKLFKNSLRGASWSCAEMRGNIPIYGGQILDHSKRGGGSKGDKMSSSDQLIYEPLEVKPEKNVRA